MKLFGKQHPTVVAKPGETVITLRTPVMEKPQSKYLLLVIVSDGHGQSLYRRFIAMSYDYTWTVDCYDLVPGVASPVECPACHEAVEVAEPIRVIIPIRCPDVRARDEFRTLLDEIPGVQQVVTITL